MKEKSIRLTVMLCALVCDPLHWLPGFCYRLRFGLGLSFSDPIHVLTCISSSKVPLSSLFFFLSTWAELLSIDFIAHGGLGRPLCFLLISHKGF